MIKIVWILIRNLYKKTKIFIKKWKKVGIFYKNKWVLDRKIIKIRLINIKILKNP